MTNEVVDFAEGIEFGNAQKHKNMTVLPLIATWSAGPEYITLGQARKAGVLTDDEAVKLLEQDRRVMEIIHVDDFAPGDIGRKPARAARKRTTRKKAKSSRRASKPADEASDEAS